MDKRELLQKLFAINNLLKDMQHQEQQSDAANRSNLQGYIFSVTQTLQKTVGLVISQMQIPLCEGSCASSEMMQARSLVCEILKTGEHFQTKKHLENNDFIVEIQEIASEICFKMS